MEMKRAADREKKGKKEYALKCKTIEIVRLFSCGILGLYIKEEKNIQPKTYNFILISFNFIFFRLRVKLHIRFKATKNSSSKSKAKKKGTDEG